MYLVAVCLFSLLSSLLQPRRCDAVRVDPSIIGQPWTELEAATSSLPDAVGVAYSLIGQGYHRALEARLWREKGDSISWNDEFLIVLNVTSSIYIDLDQISQMAKFGGPDVIASGHIDTEAPAMISENHTVLVYLTMQNNRAECKILLHFRYLATGPAPYSTVTIPTPLLLSLTTEDGVSLPCSPTSPALCHWHLSPLTPHPSHSHSALVAMVPVGQSDHVIAVAIVTVIFTFGSVLYLTYTIL